MKSYGGIPINGRSLLRSTFKSFSESIERNSNSRSPIATAAISLPMQISVLFSKSRRSMAADKLGAGPSFGTINNISTECGLENWAFGPRPGFRGLFVRIYESDVLRFHAGQYRRQLLVQLAREPMGTRLKVLFSDFGYVQLGAYEDNPRYLLTRNALDLGEPGGATGVLVAFEVGWQPTFGDGLDGSYKFGAWYNSSKAPDIVDNTNGQPLALDGGQPLMHNGQYGAYVNFLQRLTPPQSLAQNVESASFLTRLSPIDKPRHSTTRSRLGSSIPALSLCVPPTRSASPSAALTSTAASQLSKASRTRLDLDRSVSELGIRGGDFL